MKIAVNTRFLIPQKLEGIGWFTFEIFRRLSQRHPEVEWLFIWDRPFDPSYLFTPTVRGRYLGPPARHPLLWYLWFEYSLPYILAREKPDLLISPDGYLPLRTSTPSLAVIHDINFEHQKQNIDRVAGAYMRYFFPQFARKATRIATVSEYSRQDIAQTYAIASTKIDLVYNGVGDFFRPLQAEERQALRERLCAGRPYFVFVGALNPRKNIDGMLEAYALYRKAGGGAHFVIVGDKMFWHAGLQKVYEEHPYRQDIHFSGRLQGEALNQYLGAAQALAFVSHFEGFGIPILEAFRCDIPVITATNSSMPEVAGEAAWLCDSRRPEAIAAAMRESDDPQKAAQKRALGRLRLQHFSWDRSADMMWQSIQKSLAH